MSLRTSALSTSPKALLEDEGQKEAPARPEFPSDHRAPMRLKGGPVCSSAANSGSGEVSESEESNHMPHGRCSSHTQLKELGCLGCPLRQAPARGPRHTCFTAEPTSHHQPLRPHGATQKDKGQTESEEARGTRFH